MNSSDKAKKLIINGKKFIKEKQFKSAKEELEVAVNF